MKKLFLMALTMLSSIGVWGGVVTIPTAVGSYISTAEAPLTKCYSENGGKDIGSTHNGSTMTMSLNNTTAGDYFLQFLSGASGLTATIRIDITGANYNQSKNFNIANTGSWTPSIFHAMELKDLPAGNLTLTLTVTSTTGGYAGNYGSFAIHAASQFNQIPGNIDLTKGVYSTARVESGGNVGYCSNGATATYTVYNSVKGTATLKMGLIKYGEGTLNAVITDIKTGVVEVNKPLTITNDAKSYDTPTAFELGELTTGLKTIKFTVTTTSSFLCNYKNVSVDVAPYIEPKMQSITLGETDILDAMVDNAYTMDVAAYSEIPVVAATANAQGKVEVTQADAANNYVATVVLKDKTTNEEVERYTITFHNINILDGYTFTWTTNDGHNTSTALTNDLEGYKAIRVSTVNPLFALKSTYRVYNDGRFKSSMNEKMALVIPENAIVSKVEFINCSENYYKSDNDETKNITTTFTVASAGATVVTTDQNGDILQYLSTGQTITATLTGHVAGTPITFVAAGGGEGEGGQLAYSGIKIYYALTNKGSLTKIGQSIEANAVLSRSGKISVTFDNNISLVANASMMINGQPISTEAIDASLVGYYTGLNYGGSYTVTLAANSVKDPFDNYYTEAISIPFTIVAKPTVEKAAFDAIVSNGTELAAAIAAANNRADQNVRYRIFIKSGAHILPTNGTTIGGDDQTYPDPRTTMTANNVSIIGADYNTTSFTNITPAATWDNSFGQACPLEGIGKGDVLINKGTANYFQGVMIKTSMGDAHGRDIAFNDQGKKTIFKDAALWGYQDTYVSNNSNDGRFYFEGGLIRGRTDYLCGKGDVYYNQVTLQCVGTGALIAVPSLPTKYGYIFKDCHIVKETQDVTYNFGRPWGKGTPIALFIDTKVDAAPIEAGWEEMVDGWPDRFAEYNTYLASDNSTVSTTNRKHTYASTHECNPILTAAEAAYYSNLTRILSGNDGWDPTELTEQVAVSDVALNGAELSWDDSDYALCWVIFKDGEYYANVTENTLLLIETGDYTVRAANAMGGLGAASAAFHYDAPTVHTRTVPAGEYGTICLPYDAEAQNAVVMSIKGTTPDKSGVVFEYVGDTEETSTTLEAGRPYLYRATADEQTFTCDMSSQVVTTPIEENKFVGTYEKISPLERGLYFLYSDNLFHPAGDKISIGAYRCYFNTSNVNEIADATSVSAPDRIVVLGTYNPNVTGVENTECNMHSTKCIVNGKIVIRRGDRTYSILGQRY